MEAKSHFHELSPDEVPYKNPFVHRLSIPPLRRLQMGLIAVTILPFRLLGLAVFFTLAFLCSEMATRWSDPGKPMSGFKKTILLPVFNFFGRLVFFCVGFQWITTKGTRASPEEAPIIVLAPHSSFFDSLLVVLLGLPSVVGKTETANSPIGCLIKMTQPILVNRDDPSSRQKTLQEINRRSQSNGEWPQILIFPEGTCTNRSCLINYKQGAFSSGCPVQPAVIRWGNAVDTITWTWEGPGVVKIFLATLLQPHNPVEIEFLPVYVPSEEEQADPQMYAQNVRAIMAKALNLPTTDLSFDDCRRIRTAAQHNLPMACHIIEYGRLTRMLFSTDSAVESPGVESVTKQSRLHRITKRLREIAEAARLWHTQLSTCHWPSPALANLEPIFLRDGKADEKAVSLLRQLTCALPKTTNNQPDLRVFVVHLCFLMFAEAPLQALRIAFQVYDRAASSSSPERQKPTANEESSLQTGAPEMLFLADADATQDLADWAILPEDVESLLHSAYLLKFKDTRSLLKKHRLDLGRPVLAELSSVAKADGDTIPADGHEHSALLLQKHTTETLAGVLPDALYNALSMDYPKLVNSYGDYRSEMQRVRRRLERPFSDTASSSASVSSIYSLNDPTNGPTTETLVNADFALPLADTIFAHKPGLGHQRTDSNVSSSCESEYDLGDGGIRLRTSSAAVDA
uniref:Phospholipid/glycerol acyltransferase domain-containing protein n=1 Tax=Schistocephalus solidus TaxID=70667 RepID=A0A0X3NYX8_SCHSO